ncbi:MAG: peptide deformylase [Atopobium sp.]|uniref:peptide deformylase n=1 Tax=Atopobium sp. TaxID=1872650 RepID=UPI002A833250|nr:peptide deformylase [Atopobium sp.]MDY4522433.1 peptide deformylase [Atopobium sp.]
MSALDDIVLSPDPRLKQVCTPIEHIDGHIKQLAKRMLRDMYAADGCGLAAPQIGENIQMVVIDVDYADGKKNPYILINPEIITADGTPQVYNEGCLSFPGISVPVERPSHVVVRALNLDGELMEYEAEGNLLAICLQHEIDHLQGITMVDHLSITQRAAAMREYEQALAAGARPGDTEMC